MDGRMLLLLMVATGSAVMVGLILGVESLMSWVFDRKVRQMVERVLREKGMLP